MTTKKKTGSRLLSAFLAVLMIISLIPSTVFAAPAADIPDEMLDNAYLDALADVYKRQILDWIPCASRTKD